MKLWIERAVSIFLAGTLLLPLPACGGKPPREPDQGDGSEQSGSQFPGTPPVTEPFTQAQKENSDVVAWLTLPNTTINEAVVQTTNNEFYLRRNIKKGYSYEGCYYMDYESVMFDEGKDLAQNTIIYGHNLGSPLGVRDDPEGVKFAQLLKLNDPEIAKKTPYLYLTTESGAHVFEIFAVFYCEAETQPVPYHLAHYTEERFSSLIADVKSRSTFLYDVTVKPDDRIITLSTCSYLYGTYSQNPHQRFVLMGRLVGEKEKYHEQAAIRKNENPKLPPYAKK